MKFSLSVLTVLFLCAAPDTPRSFHVAVQQISWRPVSIPGFPPGLEQRVLHENKLNGLSSLIIKYPKGYREPRHYHKTCGHSIYVLKGRLQSPGGDYPAGTFIYSAPMERHGPFLAVQETEILIYTDGPFDIYVDDKK